MYTRFYLKGDWMEQGYIQDLAVRQLTIDVRDDGRIYAVDEYDRRYLRLDLDSERRFVGWTDGVSFSPDAGELKRVFGDPAPAGPIAKLVMLLERQDLPCGSISIAVRLTRHMEDRSRAADIVIRALRAVTTDQAVGVP